MSAGMPELGSKISLISKADIRYEGRLFTVDPKECTIALASVRSFGTEDRETPYPVPAQNQVYDYILFRGSDIKDIRVVNNVAQPLNDPAIMQLSVPPSLGQAQFQTHPMLGHPMGQFAAPAAGYGNMAGLSGGGMNAGPVPIGAGMPRDPRIGVVLGMPNKIDLEAGNVAAAVDTQQISTDNASVLDIIGGGSRSLTPASLGSSIKSPTNEAGTQAGGANKRPTNTGDDNKKQVKPIQPPRNQQHYQHNNQRKSLSQERRHSGGQGDGYRNHQQNRGQMNQQQQQQPQHQQHQQNRYQGQGQRQQGGWVNRGGPMLRQRGRPRGGNNGYKPNNQGQLQPTGANKKNPLKFDNDYDFEQANTEFEELRNQIAKVKIDEAAAAAASTVSATVAATAVSASSSTTATNNDLIATVSSIKTEEVTQNGTNDLDKKDDSGNETGAGEGEHEEEGEVFYDKTKSFFDKISCEAVERAKGKSQRTDWRVERKLNSETFGVAATRRGNFRGRGGFRGMGFRGGNNYRGGYRPQQYQQQRRDNNGGGQRSGGQQNSERVSNNIEQAQQNVVPVGGGTQ